MAVVLTGLSLASVAAEEATRVYRNALTLLDSPGSLFADYPEFIQLIEEVRCYEAPLLVDDVLIIDHEGDKPLKSSSMGNEPRHDLLAGSAIDDCLIY